MKTPSLLAASVLALGALAASAAMAAQPEPGTEGAEAAPAAPDSGATDSALPQYVPDEEDDGWSIGGDDTGGGDDSVGGPAPGGVKLEFGGSFTTNFWLTVQSNSLQGFNLEGEPEEKTNTLGPSRVENILKLKLDASSGRFRGFADIDFVLTGFPMGVDEFGALQQGQTIHPFRWEAQSLYVEARDIFFEGFDLRIGQQLVQWGQGDQFNPTNTVNANDVENPLLFGEQQANFMLKASYAISDEWSAMGVVVPVFKPAMLPASAVLGLAATDRQPMQEASVRHKAHADQGFTRQAGFPTVVEKVIPELPETNFENMQYALQVRGVIGDHDLILSYHYGRSDIPQAVRNTTRQAKVPPDCTDPADLETCNKEPILSTVTLGYPRQQVIGLNMGGEIDLLGFIPGVKAFGYRLEVGVYIPEKTHIAIINNPLRVWAPLSDGGLVLPVNQPVGEYDYELPGEERPTVIDDTPFAKWTLGLDYTFSDNVYLNMQWVHGFVDEFGAGDWLSEGYKVRAGGVHTGLYDDPDDPDDAYTLGCGTAADVTTIVPIDAARCARETLRPSIADYLVLGVDFKTNDQKFLFRFFTIWDLSGVWEAKWDSATQKTELEHFSMFTPEGFTAILFPEMNYNFGDGFELGGGALIQLGKPYSRFGDPANGGSIVWTRVRYSF